MLTRKLPDGRTVSLLGFGTMRLPVDKDKKIIQEQVNAMTDAAFEGGVCYFDTAYPYHDQKSEASIGQALKSHPRDSFIIADKMPVPFVETEEDLERIFSIQLERTGLDFFDVYLLHALDNDRFDKAEKLHMYDFLVQKKAEGKIKNIGFSFHDSPEVLQKIVSTHKWDVAQIQLNYIDRDLQRAEEQYQILTDAGIGVLVMEPIRGGYLSNLPTEAHQALAAVHPDWSDSSWALRWVATHPNVRVILSGMSNMEQLKENIHTAETFRKLTPEEEAVIAKALDVFKKNNTVPCTACRYCQPCPMGVEIPRIFTAWNQYRITKNANNFKSTYSEIPDEAQAHNCVACGACMEQCPQHIQIPDLMTEIANAYEALK